MTTTRRARQLERERLERVTEACVDERRRFNAAIAAGAQISLTVATYEEPLRVSGVDSNWWYHTPAGNGGFGCSWAGCNDGTWSDLLRQAGVARHPLFAEVRS
jgi:hypothetical protein